MVSCRSSNQSIRLPAKLPRHSWNGRRLREARPTLEKDDRKGLQRGARELFWHFVGDVPGVYNDVYGVLFAFFFIQSCLVML